MDRGVWQTTVHGVEKKYNRSSMYALFTIVSFAVRKLLSLIRSHLFVFDFISVTLAGGSKRILCDVCQSVHCLCFPLRKHVVIFLKFLVTSRNTWEEIFKFAIIILSGRLNNGLLKIPMLEFPEPVNMLP